MVKGYTTGWRWGASKQGGKWIESTRNLWPYSFPERTELFNVMTCLANKEPAIQHMHDVDLTEATRAGEQMGPHIASISRRRASMNSQVSNVPCASEHRGESD